MPFMPRIRSASLELCERKISYVSYLVNTATSSMFAQNNYFCLYETDLQNNPSANVTS